MAAQVNVTTAARVDEAIVRVLQAEQAARAAVEQYALDAEDIRSGARARAHTIAERAAGRVARAHHWTDAAIRARVDHLNEERAALQLTAPLDPDEPIRVARALDRLAAEVIGGTE